MHRYLLLAGLVLTVGAGRAQSVTPAALLPRVEQLTGEKKYAAAYKLLDGADPKTSSPACCCARKSWCWRTISSAWATEASA
ncbi:hypothetical protein [Hymenobacter persicinus]|uniref:Uncharacterized protein n=1 Tax=Hymenobacter persicinus TaxID=2025506 RepID=A0A4Q5LEY6_9BACT|nr:hypothetical protein [Hymenobacter persicinus]RYU81081.1 hypothetical protein EWM57_07520 [Hymenobacter persicinus]